MNRTFRYNCDKGSRTGSLAVPLWFCAITATIALVAVVTAVILAGPPQPRAAADSEHSGHNGTEL